MIVELCETLVWVLIHSLWQGILIAGLVSVLLRSLPARRAESRYGAGLAGLGLIVLSSLVTWSVLTLDPTLEAAVETGSGITSTPDPRGNPALEDMHIEHPSVPIAHMVATASQPRSSVGSNFALRNWMPWVAAVWFMGASVMLIRAVAAIVQVRQWRTSVAALASSSLDSLNTLKQELCEQLQLRRLVSLIVSDRVNVPSVVGSLWPCILIPPAMLTGIPLDLWRVILTHELAHIRRYDVLVNLIQMLIESLFFFNPAVWWLSHQIRVEREACCDALAAKVCGQPLAVARTLVEFAASIQFGGSIEANWTAARPTSVMAFADQATPGELTDRVQRLVEPNIAARPRISWLALSIVLGSLLLAGLALHWGTDLAVQTAVNIMSPRERIAKLEQLQETATGVFLPPEPPQSSDAKTGEAPVETKPGKVAKNIPVTVVVRTDDGSSVPKNLSIHSLTVQKNSTGASTFDFTNAEVKEYRKTVEYAPCQLRFGARAVGYAPVVSPILRITPEDKPHTVELILTKGTTVKLSIRDHEDRPLAGATAIVSAGISIQGSSSGLGNQEYIADTAGEILIEHAGTAKYDVRLRIPGFQRQQRNLEFKPSEAVRLELQPATPVAYQVVDAATGKPVAQARFVVASTRRSGNGNNSGDPREQSATDRWLNYAMSNSEGVVVLNELQEGTRYTFGVLADGYAMTVLEDVYSGQAAAVVKLVPPLTLAGHIEGELDRLGQVRRDATGKPYREFSYSHRVNNSIQDASRTRVDETGKFEITGLVPGEQVSIYLVDRHVNYVMTKSLTHVTLKIGAPPEKKSARMQDVVIRLTGTTPGAPARGTLYLSSQHRELDFNDLPSGAFPLQGNEIHLSVPVGASLYIRPDNLVGYRIEEVGSTVIAAGTGAQVIEIPARPAGGIAGTIVRADGSPADSGYITIFAVQLPPDVQGHLSLNPSVSSGSATFLATPPLGGRYRILARELTGEHNSWTVSDEMTIDEAHPIAKLRLQLPEGKNVSSKLTDPDGKPAVGRDVSLSLSFRLATKPGLKQPNGHSFGTDINRTTDLAGIATFEKVSYQTAAGPLDMHFRAKVAPGKYRGWEGEVNLLKPIEIQLERGVSASGVVVDSASGKAIPQAEVVLMPNDFNSAKFRQPIRTVTDGEGRFQFDSLEPIEYHGSVIDSVPVGTIVTPQPGGGNRMEYPAGVEQHKVRGGDKTPVKWKVVIYPGSRLKVPE